MSKFSVSVVIPAADSSRNGNVDLLLRDIEAQTVNPQEVHVIKGVSPSGRARNIGARRASGDVVVFLDDDVRLGHERVFEAMITLLEDPQIGMVGASQLLSPDSLAFQKAAGRQIPRSYSSIVPEATDSDMVTTQCCAVRRVGFWELGGFNDYIPRGVDPEMRHRTRIHGLRIVVAPEAWFYHPMPANVKALCRMFFRNGMLSAEAFSLMPSAAIETPDGHVSDFASHHNMIYRTARHCAHFICDLARFRWIGILAQASYVSGYLWRSSQLRVAGRGASRRRLQDAGEGSESQ